MKPTKSTSMFTRFAKATARAMGQPAAFLGAGLAVVTWGLTGPISSWKAARSLRRELAGWCQGGAGRGDGARRAGPRLRVLDEP